MCWYDVLNAPLLYKGHHYFLKMSLLIKDESKTGEGRASRVVEQECKDAYFSRHLPVIGIVPSQNNTDKTMNVPARYTKAIVHAGGAPLLLPLVGDGRVYETLFPLVDGFVLTGGNDIDPARYGAVRDSGKISEHSPEREELEYLILSYAYRYDLPLLGICRGMQMINVCFGGTLYRDLGDQYSGAHWMGSRCQGDIPVVRHWQDFPYDRPSHYVDIKLNSKLGRLLNAERINVNSMHHQGVCDLSALVDPVAYGPDGLVEALEVRGKTFMMGVQWHPEFFKGGHRMTYVFKSLIAAAQKAHFKERGSMSVKQSNHSAEKAWPSVAFADYI